MPFDSSEAVPSIRRDDGLYEKDNFDISTATPVTIEKQKNVQELKPDTSQKTFKSKDTWEEERARAAVELMYDQSGEKVPTSRRIAWSLVNEPVRSVIGATEMTLFTEGIYPIVQTFKAVAEGLAGKQDIKLSERVRRNIFYPEEEKSIVENLPDYKDMPRWAQMVAKVSEDILLYGGASIAKARVKQALYPQDLANRLRAAEDAYVEDTVGTMDKRVGLATPEQISVMKKMEDARLRFRAGVQRELATINEASGKTIIQEDFEKRNIFNIIFDDITARLANETGSVSIGQVVSYKSPNGILVGKIKEIMGNRVTIDMDGHEIVAPLAQIRVPDIPTIEIKSVIPEKDVKKTIRKNTGQVKVDKVIKESDALKRLLTVEGQVSKEWQKDFDTAMVKELENEHMLINKYERDISKLQGKIDKGEFKLEANKIYAQFKLDKLKNKYAEVKRNAQEREYLRREIADNVQAIESLPKQNISVDYQEAINTIKDKFDLKNRSESTMKKRESMKGYVARMQQEGMPIDIPEEKLAMLDKVTLKDMTMEHLRSIRDEVERLAKLGETKLKARQAVYEAQKETIKGELVKQVKPITSKEIEPLKPGEPINKNVERIIKVRNYVQKTTVGLTPIEGLADITGMQPVKRAVDANFNKYLEFNDKDIQRWYDATKDFKRENFDRIGVYAISRQEGGMQRLEFSGVDPKDVEALKLTPDEMKAYNLARELFDKHYLAVKKYMNDVYNTTVDKVDNYVSFMSNSDAMNDLELYERFGGSPDEAIYRLKKTTEKGFTEKRSPEGYYKIERNIDKILRRHLDDVAYMLTMGKDVKMYYEIINSPEMHEALGDVGTLAWLQYFDLLARKGGSIGAKRIALLDLARRNLGAGYLGLRLSSVLVQLSSFGDSMATIGADWAFKGVVDIANDANWRNFVMDNFPEVRKAVGDDVAFREFGQDMLGKLQQAGMKPLQILDGLMRSSAACGAYQKLAAEKGIAVDLDNPDKELILEATKLMRQSQGSSFFKDQPLAITSDFGLLDNKSLNKTVLTFQSFMLNRWDNLNRQIWRIGIKSKDYKKAGMALLWIMTFGIGAEVGLRRLSKAILAGFKEDDKRKDSIMKDILLNTAQTIPIFGQLVSSIMYASNPVPIINAMTDIIEGLGSVLTGKSGTTKAKGAVRTAGAIAALGGVSGAGQLSQFIQSKIKKKKRYKVT